ncbi:hypothetical protein CAAN1_12S04500 [[Candida] anglica]|uniref:FAD-binding FR-type domain-containing protein n=1 Tax=[Candida] anglica TaxID=148631 RepID=A0ABP0E777_9ASCO
MFRITPTGRSVLCSARKIPAITPKVSFVRFNHKSSPEENENNAKNVPANNDDSTHGGLSNMKVNQVSSRAGLAPMDSGALSPLLKKDNKPYIPKLKHERLSYEYPGLPNQDEYTKHNKPASVTGRWSRHLPKIAVFAFVVWAGYSIKVWVYQPDDGSDANDILIPTEFHPFIITHKEQIDPDHFLIEVKPKFDRWKYAYYNNYLDKTIWNGKKIWSVEVKQPQIMVVRSYTPLPLYFLKSELTRSGERKPLLKVINNDEEDGDKNGTMTFYIKRYGDGEVSKYITSKNIGDEIELRGPNIEYTFPYHPMGNVYERPIFRDLPSEVECDTIDRVRDEHNIPDVDNVTFYTAGTGIAPALQVLLSRNPYQGFVNLHYSAQKPGELKPLERFIYFLEKLGRIRFIEHYDVNPKSRLNKKDIQLPEVPNYVSDLRKEAIETSANESLKIRMSILDETSNIESQEHDKKSYPRYQNALEQAIKTKHIEKKASALSIVCGPDGFVDYVSGARNDVDQEQGPVTGLLGNSKWDNTNVYKL